MAVLPTPGSPMSTGLFLVRRRQDLDDAADLLVAADDRVELAGAGLGGQVAAVLLERLVCALRVLGGDALAAADVLERAEDRLAAGAVALEERWRVAAGLGRAEQQVLGGDVLVAEPVGLVLGALDDRLRARVEAQRAALDPGAPGEDGGELDAERGQVGAELAERLGGMPSSGSSSAARMCSASRIGAVERLGQRLGGEDRLLGLLGESVELHRSGPSVRSIRRGVSGSVAWVGLVDEVEELPGGGAAPRPTGPSAGRPGPSTSRSPSRRRLRLKPRQALARRAGRSGRSGSRPGSQQDPALERRRPGPRRRGAPRAA